MSFTGGRLKLKGDDTGVKKRKKKKSKAEDESMALQLAEDATEQDAMPKVCWHDTAYAALQPLYTEHAPSHMLGAL